MELGEICLACRHWYFCLDTPGIPDEHHIVVGPYQNMQYTTSLGLGSMIAKNGKALALSLGAESSMVEKDLLDMNQFLEELYNISLYHPVTQFDFVKQILQL